MFDNEYTEDEIYYQESMKLVNEIELNKDSISSLNKDEILFIMSCNECIDFLDIHKNYYSYNLYKKELSEETIKELHFEDYDAINLGLGHALVIRKDIYNEFMKILKNEIIYEDEFNPDHVYAAWNHWVGCAIKLIDKKSNSILSIKFEKILERDVDLMIINQISFNKSFLSLFLDKISKKNYIVESIEHSLMDQEDGESDITVILSNGINKIALLIEDKIDAHAMPMQPERYIKRGKKGIENKQYDEFYDFIVAPQEYLESNMEAKQYTYRISYEEMLSVLKDVYSVELLNKAIEEKKSGYIIIENKYVTTFWEQYYSFIKNNYPTIKIHEIHGPRGSKAVWPELLTDYNQVRIIHKSDKGYLDLTFNRFGEHIDVFYKYLEGLINEEFNVVKTGKSLSIRTMVPIVDFKNDFNNYIDEMYVIMNKVLRLYEIVNKLNVLMMYEEIKNSNSEINNINDFDKKYPKGIIVNYDKGITYRCSTGNSERIGDTVEYPYIQPYQSGINPTSDLFIIKDCNLYKLNRVIANDPMSSYIKTEIKEDVSDQFYNDEVFDAIGKPPVNVGSQTLLEIIENE